MTETDASSIVNVGTITNDNYAHCNRDPKKERFNLSNTEGATLYCSRAKENKYYL
jgi:hypothetical protein